MKQRFRLYRRNGGIYYLHDSKSGKQTSLGTRERSEAIELFSARIQAHRQAHREYCGYGPGEVLAPILGPECAGADNSLPAEGHGEFSSAASSLTWTNMVRDTLPPLLFQLVSPGL